MLGKVMIKLKNERKENDMKKMSDNKQKLEREEAERLEAQKKQEELRLRKRKNHGITHSITITQLARLYL